MLASAFASQVWHLVLTQGVLYGLGASVVNTVTIQFLNEWFIERKGLAFGIQESGAGMGGIIIPYVRMRHDMRRTLMLTIRTVF